jgi:hypothetical protein
MRVTPGGIIHQDTVSFTGQALAVKPPLQPAGHQVMGNAANFSKFALTKSMILG